MLSYMSTPDFGPWAGHFTAQLQRLRTTLGPSVHQLERLFTDWIPRERLAQQEQGDHSRDRRWNLRLVFWTFLWQISQAGASCREAIRQAQALCRAGGAAPPPDTTSPYCQARAALPPPRLQDIQEGLVQEARAATAMGDLWQGHEVLVVDGSCVTAPDTAQNQQAFPQQSVQKPGCGFPILRLVGLLSLATGLLVAWATGQWQQHEMTLLQLLWAHLPPGRVLLGDRGFCSWGLLAQCRRRQVEAVFRVKGRVRRDFRRGRRLSRHERLVSWPKPARRPVTVSPEEWNALPEVLSLRLVRCRLGLPGFRTAEIILVTTFLDSASYPPAALGQLYYRRWAMELTLRNLKTTLQMDMLSCKSPAMLERELRLHILVHNLVRRLMLEAARRHRVALERISFAGALAAARRYSEALAQARSQRRRQELHDDLFRVLASALVPDRPGRREPRGIKRRPKPYPRLMCHRHHFREIQHQNRYDANSVFGPKYRKSSNS
jgi:hypothetical protein